MNCPRCKAEIYNTRTCIRCGYSLNQTPQAVMLQGNAFSRSFRLISESFRILIRDAEMLVFSLLSVLLSCAAMFFALRDIDLSKETSENPSPEFVIASLTGYFLVVFISTFGKAGITAIAYERMIGNSPTFSTGLEHIGRNLYRIFLWALFAATIGTLLQLLKNKSKWFMRLFWNIAEAIWGLIAFIALPVVVIENTSIEEGVHKTEAVFKKTWGENLVGGVSMSALLVIGLILGPLIAVFAAPLFTFSPIIARVIIFAPMVLVILIYLSLNSIYATALYYYATTGNLPSGYSEDLIKGAFVKRTR